MLKWCRQSSIYIQGMAWQMGPEDKINVSFESDVYISIPLVTEAKYVLPYRRRVGDK